MLFNKILNNKKSYIFKHINDASYKFVILQRLRGVKNITVSMYTLTINH